MLSITIILGNGCNLPCSYCPQKKNDHALPIDTIEKGLNLILTQHRQSSVSIGFYGGEPLMHPKAIEHTLGFLKREYPQKSVTYLLTTNGILLSEEILQLFAGQNLELVISHDGLWNGETRKMPPQYSLDHFSCLLEAYPHIEAQFNCVCPPSQVHLLYENVRHFSSHSRLPVLFAIDSVSQWSNSELTRLDLELQKIKQENDLPCNLLNPIKPGDHQCSFTERFTIDPDANLWGCQLFYGAYLKNPELKQKKRFSPFNLNEMDQKSLEILKDWDQLKPLKKRECLSEQSPCLFCEALPYCSACPVNGALGSGEIGRFREWHCRIQKIIIKNSRRA